MGLTTKDVEFKKLPAPKQQRLINSCVRTALADYRAAGGNKKFDGSGSSFFEAKYNVRTADIWGTSDWNSITDKMKLTVLVNFNDNQEKLTKKVMTALRKKGYKVEQAGGYSFNMWKKKVTRRK